MKKVETIKIKYPVGTKVNYLSGKDEMIIIGYQYVPPVNEVTYILQKADGQKATERESHIKEKAKNTSIGFEYNYENTDTGNDTVQ